MWHPASGGSGIIGTASTDVEATEVGWVFGMGPQVVDLQRRVYWTC